VKTERIEKGSFPPNWVQGPDLDEQSAVAYVPLSSVRRSRPGSPARTRIGLINSLSSRATSNTTILSDFLFPCKEIRSPAIDRPLPCLLQRATASHRV
jgi:hypothetical protein